MNMERDSLIKNLDRLPRIISKLLTINRAIVPHLLVLALPKGLVNTYVIPPRLHSGAERSTVLPGKNKMGIGESMDKKILPKCLQEV
jgi:hypothetical protein